MSRSSTGLTKGARSRASAAAEDPSRDAERIAVRDVSKVFFSGDSKFLALREVSLQVASGEFVGLVGPSGCGKSTLLNIVAGLETADRGEVLYNGRPVTGLNSAVGYMTQKDTLLPWRDIVTNVALALRLKGIGSTAALERARRWLALVGLAGFENYMPDQLSGGMLKRAALARTLVAELDTVLMDEPFGNVDAQIRIQLHRELMKIWGDQRCTVLFVTHDLEEAVALCDRIVVLSAQPGRITAVLPVDLPRPRDPATVRFSTEFQTIHERLWELMTGPVQTPGPGEVTQSL